MRIARYSLPSFQVTASPSEPTFLPGDEATVEVEVKTLDGAALADVGLRLSARPIHVYAFGTLPGEGQPGQAYVTTAYADGRPASCTVELWQRQVSPPAPQGALPGDDELLLGSFETGPLGVARVPDEVLRREVQDVRIVARDGDGGSGITDGDPWDGDLWDDAPRLLIDSPRTLLRRGEPLRVTLHPHEPMERVLVEVLRDGERLDFRLLPRLDSSTPVDFGSRPEYAGKITVAAYPLSLKDGRHDPPGARRTLFYPRGDDSLRLRLESGRERYRPGEPVRLDFRLNDETRAAALPGDRRRRGRGAAGSRRPGRGTGFPAEPRYRNGSLGDVGASTGGSGLDRPEPSGPRSRRAAAARSRPRRRGTRLFPGRSRPRRRPVEPGGGGEASAPDVLRRADACAPSVSRT